MHGVRFKTDGKMLLHSQCSGVTHVRNSVLSLFAVMNKQLSCFHVNVIQPQRANFADPQPAALNDN
jgi:hypothetical protein